MKRLPISYLIAILTALQAQHSAAMDCEPGAVDAYENAQAALQENRYDEARILLQEATAACDSPSNWQALGDAWVAGLESAEEPELAETSALQAYGNAFSSARRAQDNPAGAEAARSIVELGLLTGDPLKAQNWLLIASQLDPEHPDVPQLQAAVDTARAELSTEEIDTGFSQTRGLGRVNNLLGGGVTSSAFWDPAAEPEINNPEEGAELASSGGGSSSLSIPIKFESNSVNVTEDTAENIENLAKVLAAQADTASFTLIGHADVRGDDNYNLQLSQQRATEIMGTLISLEPSLDGRIVALGDGESRPVDTGNNARAHANNRRLEVVISQN